jgi:hypothetical protein
MTKAKLIVPGKALGVGKELREQLSEWCKKGDFELVFLDDTSIKELADGPPVTFFPMTDRSLSVEANIKFFFDNVKMDAEIHPDLVDIQTLLGVAPVQEECETDEKVPHLERGGFLGRGKRGAINYRRVK